MKYRSVIGLEIHVELATETKLFCSCSAKAFGAEPNTHVCPACLGMPGALPRLNRRAVDLALKAALLLDCQISPTSSFDKKNYFYPDLPSGYQLTQWFSPIATNGFLDIGGPLNIHNASHEPITFDNPNNVFLDIGEPLNIHNASHEPITFDNPNNVFLDIGEPLSIHNASHEPITFDDPSSGNPSICDNPSSGTNWKRIGIKQIHIEEDAGKLIHEGDHTLADMNRSGVPLIEIVTHPDLSTAEEVEAFLDKLRTLLRFTRISGAVMAKGELRCDVNLSVRPEGSEQSGVRVELKNMNSVEAIKKAVKYETERHIRALNGEGEPITAESRGWDETAGVSFSMRTKESAADYRYFPDPNVPPLHVDKEWIDRIRTELPRLPEERHRRYVEEYGLSDYDASQISSTLALCNCFEEAVKVCKKPKDTVNWLLSEVMGELNSRALTKDELPITGAALGETVLLTSSGRISRAGARKILNAMFDDPSISPEEYAEKNGLTVTNDTELLVKTAKEAISADPKSVSDYLGGKEKALMALFGRCMKALGGNCDPQELKKVLVSAINEIKQ